MQFSCALSRLSWVTMVWSGWETSRPVTQLRAKSRHKVKTYGSQVFNIYGSWALLQTVSTELRSHPHVGHVSFAGTSAGRSPHINFDLVLQRINELNILAGESFVQTTATGAKLATKDPVPLRLYSNGIVMFDGPFRSYQEPSTQVSFLKLWWKLPACDWNIFRLKLLSLVLTAVHARPNGWLFSIWASTKISKRCTIWGAPPNILSHPKCAHFWLENFWAGSRQATWGIYLQVAMGYVPRWRTGSLWGERWLIKCSQLSATGFVLHLSLSHSLQRELCLRCHLDFLIFLQVRAWKLGSSWADCPRW